MIRSSFLRLVGLAAITLLIAAAAPSHLPAQGLLGGLRDRIRGPQQEEVQATPEPQATPPPAERRRNSNSNANNANRANNSNNNERPRRVEGTPPPSANDQPRPELDPAKIKAGAARLARELSWDGIPRDLFRSYLGNWEGNQWVYSPVGKKKQIQKVKIEYVMQDDGTMKMTAFSFDLVSRAWVTQDIAIYRINGDTVNVDVMGPDMKLRQKQTGHYSDGQLFLQSKISDGVEHSRERVQDNRLLIDGFGVYGKVTGTDHNIFVGRFTRAR